MYEGERVLSCALAHHQDDAPPQCAMRSAGVRRQSLGVPGAGASPSHRGS